MPPVSPNPLENQDNEKNSTNSFKSDMSISPLKEESVQYLLEDNSNKLPDKNTTCNNSSKELENLVQERKSVISENVFQCRISVISENKHINKIDKLMENTFAIEEDCFGNKNNTLKRWESLNNVSQSPSKRKENMKLLLEKMGKEAQGKPDEKECKLSNFLFRSPKQKTNPYLQLSPNKTENKSANFPMRILSPAQLNEHILVENYYSMLKNKSPKPKSPTMNVSRSLQNNDVYKTPTSTGKRGRFTRSESVIKKKLNYEIEDENTINNNKISPKKSGDVQNDSSDVNIFDNPKIPINISKVDSLPSVFRFPSPPEATWMPKKQKQKSRDELNKPLWHFGLKNYDEQEYVMPLSPIEDDNQELNLRLVESNQVNYHNKALFENLKNKNKLNGEEIRKLVQLSLINSQTLPANVNVDEFIDLCGALLQNNNAVTLNDVNNINLENISGDLLSFSQNVDNKNEVPNYNDLLLIDDDLDINIDEYNVDLFDDLNEYDEPDTMRSDDESYNREFSSPNVFTYDYIEENDSDSNSTDCLAISPDRVKSISEEWPSEPIVSDDDNENVNIDDKNEEKPGFDTEKWVVSQKQSKLTITEDEEKWNQPGSSAQYLNSLYLEESKIDDNVFLEQAGPSGITAADYVFDSSSESTSSPLTEEFHLPGCQQKPKVVKKVQFKIDKNLLTKEKDEKGNIADNIVLSKLRNMKKSPCKLKLKRRQRIGLLPKKSKIVFKFPSKRHVFKKATDLLKVCNEEPSSPLFVASTQFSNNLKDRISNPLTFRKYRYDVSTCSGEFLWKQRQKCNIMELLDVRMRRGALVSSQKNYISNYFFPNTARTLYEFTTAIRGGFYSHTGRHFLTLSTNEIVVFNTTNQVYTIKKIAKSEKSTISAGDIAKDDAFFAYALCNDDSYTQTLDKLTGHLFASTPPLDLSTNYNISEECRRSTYKYLENLKQYKFWAMQMYDATAKITSGILNGNVNQFGDFDMCLAAKSEDGKIKGKYCLAEVQFDKPSNLYLQGIHKLVQSHYAFESTLDDPGHRVPRYSSINWAFCIPNSCSNYDLQIYLNQKLNELFGNTEVSFKLKVDEEMCQVARDNTIPRSTLIVGSFFLTIFAIVLGATLYDFIGLNYKNTTTDQVIMAFSLKKNITSMISLDRSSSDLQAVHGIRCLNALMLLLAHKSMAVFFVPYVNRTAMSEMLGQPWTVLGRAASLYTDPFIMISGTLTAYSLLGRLEKTGKINIKQEYMSRLLRIVPTFGALILFCTFILPFLGTGPLWNLVVTHHSTICKQNWWRNMLFIHNYFGFKDMCLTHTHHVGIDMQLFFLSPFLILILFKWPKKGSLFLAGLATLSTIMRYYVTYSRNLSNYVHFGTSVKQLFETADNMYILPAHRLTVYIMGIFLAYILRYGHNLNLRPIYIHIGNTLAILSFCLSFFGPAFMGDINYVYKPIDGAMYAAFAPILWSFTFAWIVFTVHFGYKGLDAGFIGKLFSMPAFLLWTKVSYTVYLTQFPIFFFNVGSTREAKHYGFFTMMGNLQEYFWVVLTASILTVMFELPFQNIRNIIFNKSINNNKVKTS